MSLKLVAEANRSISGGAFPLVRFTHNEFAQVNKYSNGAIFQHINLQYSGIPIDLQKSKLQLGVEIIRNGTRINGTEISPKLSFNEIILLEMIELSHSLSLLGLSLYFDKLLLHNQSSLFGSLYDRYYPVAKITERELENSLFFVRKFRVIDIIRQ